MVVPEYIADVGSKKGEKVDYAIMNDGKPLILIEAKSIHENLDNHNNQLVRYFTVTDAKFGILTNGIEYRFFSDLDEKNKMDITPFMVINMLNLKERNKRDLERFARDKLNLDAILDMANRKKYTTGIKSVIKDQMQKPSDDFAKFFIAQITNKRATQGLVEEFKEYVRASLNEIINDIANEKINSIKNELQFQNQENSNPNEDKIESENGNEISTEELEGFHIVRAILSESIDSRKLGYRNTNNYLGIVCDDSRRKWICYLHFKTANKYISFNDGIDERIKIEKLEDIYTFKDKLLEVIQKFC
ncbi:Uncharacterized conserved protein [Helicobacter muridarum]|uniref:Uncharacterized conserved protein n=2 Tax=Helicobacter muridarum TaxID=216 RepID=A0A377PTB1_9HELI|nr:Uncharacterized conserved protein [Helicobacter muridarum]